MKILFIASEVFPFAKTGGLADVAGALPRALAARGHDVRIITPLYRSTDPEKHQLRPFIPELWINFPAGRVPGRVRMSYLPDGAASSLEDQASHPAAAGGPPRTHVKPVPVYFVDCPLFFDRPGIYGENGRDYADNALRFAYFNMAAVWTLKALGWSPDILHCNDWQTAFLPVFLRSQVKYRYDSFFAKTRILYSIHNLAYQGLCGFDLLEKVGLSPTLFQAEQMEYWGRLSPMKGGIAFSDWIGTVSPRYSREILIQRFGCGIEGFLANRADRLTGILNGIDSSIWDPAVDPLIWKNYSPGDLSGKAKCKSRLQKTLGLPARAKTPLLAMINRLDAQKGIDLFLETLPRLLALGAQVVVLGSGRPDYHARLERAAKENPKALQVRLRFDNALSHAIEAGADAFMILSHYEPCGLNQMYSLKYGTVPIVRHTGGLADTVCHTTPETLADGTATGFTFLEGDPDVLLQTVRRALDIYRARPGDWRAIQLNGMRQDLSWSRSAETYEALYQKMLSRPSPFLPVFG